MTATPGNSGPPVPAAGGSQALGMTREMSSLVPCTSTGGAQALPPCVDCITLPGVGTEVATTSGSGAGASGSPPADCEDT